MALTKYKLGELIELVDERNSDNLFGTDSVVGLGTQKEIISTKADLDGVSLTSYKWFPPKSFAYVPDTSRRGDKISLALNTDEKIFLVSSISIVFKVGREDILLPDYLFMYFNRPEFDRYARFHSWGSARESFSWAEMCEMEINLPPLAVQKKFVAVYNSLLENKKVYERGLDDLKLVCDGYIDQLKRTTKKFQLGELLKEIDERNTNGEYKTAYGINITKNFMPSAASSDDLRRYKIVHQNQFACNLMHVGRDEVIPVALNDWEFPLILSPSYIVFKIRSSVIVPEYLFIWLSRNETDRRAWFLCDTSVRSGMEKKRFFEIEIPIPALKIQRSIAAIYEVLRTRKKILERLKAQIKNICPILIKGSLDEGATT